MAWRIQVAGVTREFEFFRPLGWEENVAELRRGLPLVIALHDTRLGPSLFRAFWPFDQVASTPGAGAGERFFVLFPRAVAYSVGVPLTELSAAGEEHVWNYGYDSRGYHRDDDVAFVQAMLDAVEAMLTAQLAAARPLEPAIPPIDADRIFLFGWGEGGMMAYKLVSAMQDKFAALWVGSASHGGVRHQRQNGVVPPIVHEPSGRPVSLYLLYGGLDEFVSPLGVGGVPVLSEADLQRIDGEANLPLVSQGFARMDLGPLDASDLYVSHNFPVASKSLVRAAVSIQPAAYTATITSHVAGWPPRGAEVVVHEDGGMTHSNLVMTQPDIPLDRAAALALERPTPDRYATAQTVWDWLKQHPRAQ